MSTPAELLDLATELAREAGDVLRSHFGSSDLATDSKSTPTDPVTEADRAAERLIRERLAAARPDDAILGEEGGSAAGTSRVRWIVDPLDGTVNFLYGLPQWSVSVAAEVDGETVAGVVYDPLRDELWSAGEDARCNGEPIRPSGREELATALVATGFGYDADVRRVQGQIVARLLPQVRDIRRFGSAALDLAWTAAGRYDAYFERGVKAWDIASGALICRRVGLAVRDLAPVPPAEAGVLVGPAALLDALEPLLGR
jgi:myo-inositol-1(or 4)-monophosphatase